jgi:hypothetical protein
VNETPLLEGIWLHLSLPLIEYLRVTTLAGIIAETCLIAHFWRWRSALVAPLGVVAAQSIHEWIGGTLYVLWWNGTNEALEPVTLTTITGSPTGYFGWYVVWLAIITAAIWLLICKKPGRWSSILLVIFAVGMVAWIMSGFHSNKASLVLAGIQNFDYVSEFFDVLTKNTFVLAFGLWKKS